MGERGPLPDPNARRRNKKPQLGARRAVIGRPSKPRTLVGEAAAEWNRMVPELEAMGILHVTDRSLLVQYCQMWADWVELDAALQKTGKLVKGQGGGLVRNPVWLLRRDAAADLAELSRLLVLGPTARLRVSIVHERPEEDVEGPKKPAILNHYRQAFG